MLVDRERSEGNGFIVLKTLPQVTTSKEIISLLIVFSIFSFVYNLPEWLQPNTVWGWNHQQNAGEWKSVWWVLNQTFSGNANLNVYFRRNVEQCIFPQHPLHRFFQQSWPLQREDQDHPADFGLQGLFWTPAIWRGLVRTESSIKVKKILLWKILWN